MLVKRRLVVEVTKLLEQEAELTTVETALYSGDIDLNFWRGILLPRNHKKEFIRSILKINYRNLYTTVLRQRYSKLKLFTIIGKMRGKRERFKSRSLNK